jgi:biopolymer transport protein TolR
VKEEDIRRNVAENISEERVMAMSQERSSSGGSDLNSDINVTPMVDIMLVLLIIFMVVTPLLQSGVNVSIPKGLNPDEEGDITNERAVVVSIPFPGAYYIGRDPIAKDDLVETIKNRMKLRRPDEPQAVYIRGGISVPYGDVVDVINAVRDANFQQIGLVADKLKPGEK